MKVYVTGILSDYLEQSAKILTTTVLIEFEEWGWRTTRLKKPFAYLSEPLRKLQTHNCKQYCNDQNAPQILGVNKDRILHFLHKFC